LSDYDDYTREDVSGAPSEMDHNTNPRGNLRDIM